MWSVWKECGFFFILDSVESALLLLFDLTLLELHSAQTHTGTHPPIVIFMFFVCVCLSILVVFFSVLIRWEKKTIFLAKGTPDPRNMTYTEFTLSIDLGIVGVTIRDKKAIAHPSFCHRVALKYVIWTAFFWHFAFEYVLMCAHIYMLCCAVAIPHLRFCFENRLSNYIRNAEVIRRHAQNCKSKNKMNTNNTVDAHIEWWYHSAFISLIWPIGCRNGCTSILYSVFCIQSNYKSASHRPHVFGWERARTHTKNTHTKEKTVEKRHRRRRKRKKVMRINTLLSSKSLRTGALAPSTTAHHTTSKKKDIDTEETTSTLKTTTRRCASASAHSQDRKIKTYIGRQTGSTKIDSLCMFRLYLCPFYVCKRNAYGSNTKHIFIVVFIFFGLCIENVLSTATHYVDCKSFSIQNGNFMLEIYVHQVLI